MSVLIILAIVAFVSPRFNHRRPADPDAHVTPDQVATTSPAPRADIDAPPTANPVYPDVEQVLRAVEADGYAFSQPGADRGPVAPNGRHGFSAQVNRATGGIRLESLAVTQSWYLEMALTGNKAPEAPQVHGPALTLPRGATEEWFYNDARGLEHGLTQFTRPQKAEGAPLKFTLALNTPLTPRLEPGARGLSFRDDTGEEILRYSGLVAKDSTGRALPARMELSSQGRELSLVVEDAGASYPVFIDPIFTTRTNSLTSNPRVAGEEYGAAVAVSGNLLAIGIPYAAKPSTGTANTGAVAIYRFVESVQAWQLVKRIYSTGASNDGENSRFGAALALEADILIVGAPDDITYSPGDGAAYIFQRDAGGADNWGQVHKVVAPAPQNLAHFGASVALDGNLAAFGEPDRNGPASADRGAVYIAARLADGTWGPVQALTTFAPQAGDNLGFWVQVTGSRVAAGAPHGESVGTPANAGVIIIHDVQVNSVGNLVAAPAQVLFDFDPNTGDRFGAAFVLEGDELVAGSPGKNTPLGGNDAGSATYFVHNGASFQFVKPLYAPDAMTGDEFGSAVAFSGDTIMIGAPRFNGGDVSLGLINDVGAVYTFERNAEGTNAWGFAEQLLRSEQEANASFGRALAGSGQFFLAAAPGDDFHVAALDAGVVDVFSRRDTAWRVTSSPTFSGEAGSQPHHASSVAIDRGLAAYGTPDLMGSGAVRVLRQNQGGEEAWGNDSSLLVSPVFQTGEFYGHSIALRGNWLLVGAPGYDGAAENTGRAYLYFRSAAGWNLHRTLEPPILTANAEFGTSVALSDRWALIGAPGMNHGFIYDRDEGGTDNWDVSTVVSGVVGGGRFGTSVTVDGNLAAFGAPLRDGVGLAGPVLDAGQVVVYRASDNFGNVMWSSVKTLPQSAGDGTWGLTNGHFGTSVSMNNGVLAVGEPGINDGAGRGRVFGINTGGLENWGHLQYLYKPHAQPGEQLGATVAVGTRKIFAGAPGRFVSGVSQGAVMVYDRDKLNLPNPAPVELTHPQGTAGDAFGAALSTEGDQLMVGAPDAISARGYPGTGAYVIYRQQNFAWARLGDPLGSQAAAGDLLGYSVSTDGEYLATGAPSRTVSGLAGAGTVYLYRRQPGETGWTLVKTLTASGDLQAAANFGTAVSLRGEVLAIGAPGYDGEGAVYMYHRNTGGADNWGLAHKITDPLVLAGDQFGAAVSVHEELVAVGAPNRNHGATVDAGAVFVYGRHVGGTNAWGFIDDFHSLMPEAFAFFGYAVSLNERGIIIGAPLEDENGANSGAAYFYRLYEDFSHWMEAEVFEPADAQANDRFGTAVSLDGALAAFGAPGESTYAANSGATYVYETTGDGETWTQRQRILIAQAEPAANRANLNFGKSLELRGNQLVVGAPGIDQGAIVNAGAAFIFERNQGYADGWGLLTKLTAAAPVAADFMGDSVATSHDLIVVGAPMADQGAQVDAGYIHLFNQPQTAFSTWSQQNFGAAAMADPLQQPTLWGQLADPDQDGIPNLIEAFMNTDPQVNGHAGSTPSAHRAVDGGIALRYRAGKESHGAIGQVKWSRDLETWHRGSFTDADDFVIETRVIEDQVGYYIMEAKISADQLVGEDTLYLRLEVTVP